MKLPLNQKYILIDKKYIPLEQSMGAYCCDNCGKLISNIAIVKSESKEIFNIGFDCLENILINNSLLSNTDKLEYEKVKKMLPKILRFSKQLKEVIKANQLTGLKFERPTNDWITYYLLRGQAKPYNTNVKIKEMNFDLLIDTLKNIFPSIEITVI